jgi:hypothetical protein
MQWLRTSKYTIFLILLGFQNLWNLINIFTKNNENVHLSVSYDFSKLMGLGKSRCDVLNGTTQRQDCPPKNPLSYHLMFYEESCMNWFTTLNCIGKV